jgi:hypothetical protein
MTLPSATQRTRKKVQNWKPQRCGRAIAAAAALIATTLLGAAEVQAAAVSVTVAPLTSISGGFAAGAATSLSSASPGPALSGRVMFRVSGSATIATVRVTKARSTWWTPSANHIVTASPASFALDTSLLTNGDYNIVINDSVFLPFQVTGSTGAPELLVDSLNGEVLADNVAWAAGDVLGLSSGPFDNVQVEALALTTIPQVVWSPPPPVTCASGPLLALQMSLPCGPQVVNGAPAALADQAEIVATLSTPNVLVAAKSRFTSVPSLRVQTHAANGFEWFPVTVQPLAESMGVLGWQLEPTGPAEPLRSAGPLTDKVLVQARVDPRVPLTLSALAVDYSVNTSAPAEHREWHDEHMTPVASARPQSAATSFTTVLDTNLLSNGTHFFDVNGHANGGFWGTRTRYAFATSNVDPSQVVLSNATSGTRPFTGSWGKNDRVGISGSPKLSLVTIEPLVRSNFPGRTWDPAVNGTTSTGLSCVATPASNLPVPLSSECVFSGGLSPIWNSEALAVELNQPPQLVKLGAVFWPVPGMTTYHFLYRVLI